MKCGENLSTVSRVLGRVTVRPVTEFGFVPANFPAARAVSFSPRIAPFLWQRPISRVISQDVRAATVKYRTCNPAL